MTRAANLAMLTVGFSAFLGHLWLHAWPAALPNVPLAIIAVTLEIIIAVCFMMYGIGPWIFGWIVEREYHGSIHKPLLGKHDQIGHAARILKWLRIYIKTDRTSVIGRD